LDIRALHANAIIHVRRGGGRGTAASRRTIPWQPQKNGMTFGDGPFVSLFLSSFSFVCAVVIELSIVID